MPPILDLQMRQLLIIMFPRGSPSSEKTKSDVEEKTNEVVVIAFYGTSCMGKSELVTFIKEKADEDGTFVQDISKDTVARPMMDAYYKEHPEMPFEDVYMTIYNEVVQKFTDDSFAPCEASNLEKTLCFLMTPGQTKTTPENSNRRHHSWI